MTDRFTEMCAWLQGQPLPEPAGQPGRQHLLPPIPRDADPGLAEIEAADLWRRLARECDPQPEGEGL